MLCALPESANLSRDHTHITLAGSAHRPNLFFPVGRVSPQTLDEEGEGVGEHCRWEPEQGEVESGCLQQVSAQPVVLFGQVGVVLHELEEGKGRGSHQCLKTSSEKQLSLHRQDVLRAIGIVADVNQVLYLGHLVGFSVFGSDPERSDTQQLQLAAGEGFLGEKEVDEFDHKKVSLPHQLVLLMHLHQPVQQYASHVLAQLHLHSPVTLSRRPALRQHEVLDLATVYFFLRGRIHRWLRERRKRQVRRQVLVPRNELFLFRVGRSVLAKFHSN